MMIPVLAVCVPVTVSIYYLIGTQLMEANLAKVVFQINGERQGSEAQKAMKINRHDD